MFAMVYDRDGIEQARYPLTNNTLGVDEYAARFGASMGITITPSAPGAVIPDGCEDYRVTLQDQPGSSVCWVSRNYVIDNTP